MRKKIFFLVFIFMLIVTAISIHPKTGGKFVFFRDDDVFDINNQNFIDLVESMQKKEVPLTLAVIPIKYSKSLKHYLEDKNMVFISSHGWIHEQFTSLDYNKQRVLLNKSKLFLEKEFNNKFNNIFVPPYDQFNEETLKALQEVKFCGISSQVIYPFTFRQKLLFRFRNVLAKLDYPTYKIEKTGIFIGKNLANYNIKDLSICIDPVNWTMREVSSEGYNVGYNELIRNYEECKKYLPIIGIVLHHEQFDVKFKADLDRFIDYIKNDTDVKIINLKDLCN